MEPKILSLLAAILGLVGSIILAVSLNRVLCEVRFCIEALSTSIESVVSSNNVFLFGGLDKRLKDANRISNSWVRSGIYCVAASAALAALSIYA